MIAGSERMATGQSTARQHPPARQEPAAASSAAPPQILGPLARQVRPLLATFVPATAKLSPSELAPVLARVDARLAAEPPTLHKQLRLLVRVLWWLPLLTHLRTMGGLAPAQRQRFLERLQDGSLAKLRLGIWGLRTLLFVGWYGDPEVQAQLGYRPNVGGWAAWRQRTAPSQSPAAGSDASSEA